eukprot:scaffold86232_cov21-Tisochrysis_lutea.AAC.2
MPREGSRFICSHSSGHVQPHAPKGQRLFFDKGCAEVEESGPNPTQLAGGSSCWEREGSKAGQLGACMGRSRVKLLSEELMVPRKS